MLIIGICDDQEVERKRLQDMVGKILFSRTEIQIRLFSSGEEVLAAINKGEFDCDLLLLDIHMPKLNGMELAHELRNRQVDVDIIFVTKSDKYIYEGYHCRAFAYILKPVDMKRLSEELNLYLDELEKTSACLNVSIQGTIQRISLADIYYIESDRRKLILHTKKGTIEFYEKMGTMEKLLKEKGFFRCHQSYMVQKKFVTEFGRNGIVIANSTIPVSRKYYDDLKSLFK